MDDMAVVVIQDDTDTEEDADAGLIQGFQALPWEKKKEESWDNVWALLYVVDADVRASFFVGGSDTAPEFFIEVYRDDGALFSCWQHPQGSRAMVKAATIIRGDSRI